MIPLECLVLLSPCPPYSSHAFSHLICEPEAESLHYLRIAVGDKVPGAVAAPPATTATAAASPPTAAAATAPAAATAIRQGGAHVSPPRPLRAISSLVSRGRLYPLTWRAILSRAWTRHVFDEHFELASLESSGIPKTSRVIEP